MYETKIQIALKINQNVKFPYKPNYGIPKFHLTWM